MKLSVSGFKSISSVERFNFKKLTLLAGINSSGKSSLIQALLLLKQTFESGGNEILKTRGDYVNANEPLDLVHGKTRKRKLEYVVTLYADEMENADEFGEYLPEGEQLQQLDIALTFSLNGTAHLDDMQIDLWYGCETERETFKLHRNTSKDTFDISSSQPAMVNNNGGKYKKNLKGYTLSFKYGFLPFFGESEGEIVSFTIIKNIQSVLSRLFAAICYVGPQRVKPELARSYSQIDFKDVGLNGENTRFLLNEKKGTMVEGYDKKLVELVNEWIVGRMNLAKSINVTRDANKLYRVMVTNESGVEVDLCQTGFGLSQILPIVTQGLLTPKGGTFIVEDPDVHMHPRVQAEAVNFFADLIAHGRKVIVETHSDHIVTRMRLLLAQGSISHDDVNVCFVTNEEGHSEYCSCALTQEGMFAEPLPEGFMDSQETDFREIIKTRLQAKSNGLANSN